MSKKRNHAVQLLDSIVSVATAERLVTVSEYLSLQGEYDTSGLVRQIQQSMVGNFINDGDVFSTADKKLNMSKCIIAYGLEDEVKKLETIRIFASGTQSQDIELIVALHGLLLNGLPLIETLSEMADSDEESDVIDLILSSFNGKHIFTVSQTFDLITNSSDYELELIRDFVLPPQ